MISTVFWVVERQQGASAHALLKEKGWLHPDIEVLHLGEASIGFPLNLEDDAIPVSYTHLTLPTKRIV